MISQNGDKLKKQAGSEVQNHVQTREQSAQQNPIVGRDAESGTGENIFDEQERDSAQDDHGTKAVDNYQTKEFRTGRENVFAMTAIDRDHNGRIDYTALLISPATVCREYQYDLGGRLSKVMYGDEVVEQYAYGKYGERLTDVTSKTKPRKFVYNDKLQLIQAGEVKYSYNSNGRLSMKMDMGDVTTYYYTESGILNEVRLPNMRKIQYIIDPLGRRVVKKINGITIESYLWDGMTTLVAVCDGQGMNHKAFTYNEEGDPVTMTYQNKTYNLATDQVGTIFMVADERGNEIKEIIHDSFGNKAFDSNEEFDTCIGFSAGLLDKDTGLVHFGYRDYDSTIGRFITPDPIGLAGGDVDVYGYCLDDPINFHDRTGLAGQSQESKDELAETVINELISTKAPSVTASEEYKKGNVEGSGIQKKGKAPKSTKHAGVDSVKRPSENGKNKKTKHAGADKVDRSPKNKSTKFAGADKHGVPSRHEKKAGVDNSSTNPAEKRLAGADQNEQSLKNNSKQKYAGADKNGIPSRQNKLAGADRTKKQKELEARIYYGDSITGHLWVDPGDGTANGKHPDGEKAVTIYGKADMRNETDAKFDRRVRIRVSPEESKAMRKALDARSANKDEMYIPGFEDCVDTVGTTLKAGNIKAPSGFKNPFPKGYIEELGKLHKNN